MFIGQDSKGPEPTEPPGPPLVAAFRQQIHPEQRVELIGGEALSLTGYAPDEFYLDPELSRRLVHPDDRPMVAAFAESRHERAQTLQQRWIRRDGRVVWMEVSSTPRQRADGSIVIEGTLRDVTERFQTVEDLRSTAKNLCHFLERAGEILFRRRFVPDAEVDYVSPGIHAITGFTADELRGDPSLADYLFGLDPRRAEAEPRTRLQSATRQDGERLWLELRTWPVCDAAGTVVAVEGIARDVTDRVRAEERLRRSEESLRALLERMPDSLVVHDAGRIVFMNSAFCKFARRSSAELIGRPIVELLPEQARPELEPRLRQAFEGKGGPLGELRIERANGKPLVMECRTVPVVFDGRRALVSFVRDITEGRDMQARLQIADRMMSVGTLAAGVAHEINNPLAFVIANQSFVARGLERVQEHLPKAAADELGLGELREALGDAQEGSERVRGIVRDLRTFSQSDDARRSRVDVRDVLDSSLRLARNEIRHRARLVCDFAEGGLVTANEARLGQVFLNLLLNAAQAIEEGHVERNEIHVSVRPAGGGRIAVRIRDTGSGIPPETLPRIFDPFFTTKPVGTGTGLGLSMCHNIVNTLGGTLEVQTKVGEGSTFTVILPRQAGDGRPPPEPEVAAPRRARVLVVDDEEAIGTALRRLLQGHQVEHVLHAREALARLQSEAHYDVILCDLIMPEITGMELHQLLMASAPDTARRMIFLTGGAFTPGAKAFLERVPNRCMEKPFDEALIERLVQEAVALPGIGKY